jgi:hypothetical protein
MNIQGTYETNLSRYKDIVFNDLLPKFGVYCALIDKMTKDLSILEKEPLIHLLLQSTEVDLFLILARLLDGNRSDKNIIKFNNYCERHRKDIFWKDKCLSNVVISKHNKMIQDNVSTIQTIANRRDKFLAHSDKEYFLEPHKINEDFPIDINSHKKLIQCFVNILNDHSDGLNGIKSMAVNDVFYASTYNLITRLTA